MLQVVTMEIAMCTMRSKEAIEAIKKSADEAHPKLVEAHGSEEALEGFLKFAVASWAAEDDYYDDEKITQE